MAYELSIKNYKEEDKNDKHLRNGQQIQQWDTLQIVRKNTFNKKCEWEKIHSIFLQRVEGPCNMSEQGQHL